MLKLPVMGVRASVRASRMTFSTAVHHRSMVPALWRPLILELGLSRKVPSRSARAVVTSLGAAWSETSNHPPALSAGSPIPDFFLLEAWIWSLNSIFSS